MNSKIIGVIVIVVVVALAGWFFLKGKGAGPLSTVTEGGYSDSNPFTGTLKAAVALGIPMKCTYEEGGVEYESVIQGKRFKGSVATEGETSSIIMLDNCIYSWSKGTTDGIKMCFSEEDTDIWDANNTESEAPTADLPDNLKCYPTTVGAGEFSLPSEVSFREFN
ncbi:MAG: hypothetical protein UV74_C0001G0043 [Candidatus Woesebacteria bacterium GW2011_GWB1_43_14]|uniref:Uncharacterized protein n=1 Tax=Candidatus Woesebacteria bacterium GW2011_GWB1_43_14 TaxID=1618578 RepID=A0A0G1GJH9_9BACT|nr:MAG: hypothetical protein UT21_C0003G0012 [Candidatus Woesebacteria bacterium GW2011_GWA1_39_11b]KKS78196.1 MAG: hypothetical protein UV51_C0002G0032 [Candidatus Woesebacteria bacterium GW2011_GWC1_42_9]KKS98933.1 MAG: hypothetical protein UV74_C0001G0043 [Candidatus Woesebacteria bacterium GW2011_GWB1_43_14]